MERHTIATRVGIRGSRMPVAARIFVEMYVQTITRHENQTTTSIKAITFGASCESCFLEQTFFRKDRGTDMKNP